MGDDDGLWVDIVENYLDLKGGDVMGYMVDGSGELVFVIMLKNGVF